MRQLVLALYAEGRTDERFLPVIIQRTADRILRQYATAPVDVLEPLSLKAEPELDNRAERILAVARKAYGYHALIIHADADAPTEDDALQHRYEPGRQLVEASEDDVCDDLLPTIPIRMTEAWLVADFEAFQDVVGTSLSADDLGFPNSPHQVEVIQNPKHELGIALDQIFSGRRRRRRVRLGQYYEPLARHVRLDELEKIPAFQQFMCDLINVLAQLRFISSESGEGLG